MKQALTLFGLAASLMAARADLILQQNVESATINGIITTQIKGDKVRMDMPATAQGAISTIMDLNTGDSVMLIHQQKAVMKLPGAEARQMIENLKKARADAGTNASPPTFADTGKTEKLGSYDTEIYTWSSPEGANETVWVAKNFPDAARIKVQMDKLNNSAIAQAAKGTAPDVNTLPGIVVKTKMEMNGQQTTSTLVAAKDESVDAAAFQTPQDYQEITPPGAGRAPTQ